MSEWPHPPHGCCVPSCPLFGYCHDECGQRTRLVTHTSVKDGYVRGQPVVWIPHHNLNGRVRVPGCFSLQGIPSKQVAPLAKWLHDHYGTWDSAAKATGIPSPTLRGIQRRERVSPQTVKVVTDAVLAHRRPRDPLRVFELSESPRLAAPVRKTWRSTKLGSSRVPIEVVRPVVTRIIEQHGSIHFAGQALSDYYTIDARSAARLFYHLTNGQRTVYQVTVDQLEEFAEAAA